MEKFSLLRGFKTEKIVSGPTEINLTPYGGNLIEVEIIHRTQNNVWTRSKLIKMRGTLDEYITYSHIVLTHYTLLQTNSGFEPEVIMEEILKNFDE
jgi:hypothetical protein